MSGARPGPTPPVCVGVIQDVLIIGGTGVFGQRLVRHLSQVDGITLHVASRSKAKAEAFVRTIAKTSTRLSAVALDRDVNLQAVLQEIKPFVVVDCSGPFQAQGYEAARMVLEAGAHLIDLADARAYLAGFKGALDDVARQFQVTALTGASSTPTLSTCVVNHVTKGWQRIESIDICITPGGKSAVGRSVIEAILSYAGKPVPIWENGRLLDTTGWRNGQMVVMPGLGHRRVAAVETFDAEYLGPRLDVRSRVSFSAGLEPRIEQWGIETLAALRSRGWVGSLAGLIPLLLKARTLTRITTSDSGGMLVDVCGLNTMGDAAQIKWSLVAHQDHGPNIPILPAAAAIKTLLQGGVPMGAGFAHEVIDLHQIMEEMTGYAIEVLGA
ncbi:MAG: saccharopine dehydrogenase NADP-binding domain-containing protein [Sulfitobacter sp.]